MGGNFVQQFVKKNQINFVHGVFTAKLAFNFVQIAAGNVPLIQRLQGKMSGLAASGGFGFVVGQCSQILTHRASILLIKLTISMALSAASAPLLPAFVPERSMACS